VFHAQVPLCARHVSYQLRLELLLHADARMASTVIMCITNVWRARTLAYTAHPLQHARVAWLPAPCDLRPHAVAHLDISATESTPNVSHAPSRVLIAQVPACARVVRNPVRPDRRPPALVQMAIIVTE
jgi:hypothetical protein